MCNRLYVNDQLWIDTAAELAAFVGPENVLQYTDDEGDVEQVDQDDLRKNGKSCMCWIAVPETMERLGYTVECDGLDWIANPSHPTPDAV